MKWASRIRMGPSLGDRRRKVWRTFSHAILKWWFSSKHDDWLILPKEKYHFESCVYCTVIVISLLTLAGRPSLTDDPGCRVVTCIQKWPEMWNLTKICIMGLNKRGCGFHVNQLSFTTVVVIHVVVLSLKANTEKYRGVKGHTIQHV